MPLALHAEGEDESRLAVPEWVHITPAGEAGEGEEHAERVVRGRDGREFAVADPEAVIASSEFPMQFDWDHESMLGFSTRAAGWIDEMVYLEEGDEERPEPGFWAHVERWTPQGRADVEAGYYRGISPVIRHQYREPAEEGGDEPPPLLLNFVNVALTNRPNLRMAMLNNEGAGAPEGTENMSHLPQELHATAIALDLDPEAATIAQYAEAAADRLTTPAPTDTEVHAQLEEARARVRSLEDAHRVAVTDLEAARAELGTYRDRERDEIIEQAIREGRTAAANREMLRRLFTTDREAFDSLTKGTAPTPITEPVTVASSTAAPTRFEDLSPREQLFAAHIREAKLRGADGKPLSGEALINKAQEMARR